MGKLIYSMITSLDGYVSDAEGDFNWKVPEGELHEFVSEQMRSVGTYLYGRRMYETMVYWETVLTEPDLPPYIHEFAKTWQAADKIVYSKTLGQVASERTRIEPVFDAEAVRALKAASDLDFTIDGPHLAAHAIRAGLVDEYQVYISPIIVGGGNRFYPDGVRVELEFLDEHRFGDGMMFLRYGVTNSTRADD